MPLRARLDGDRVQAKPPDGATVSTSDTAPVNPWRPVAVIVEAPVAPARIVRVVGLAAITKSSTV